MLVVRVVNEEALGRLFYPNQVPNASKAGVADPGDKHQFLRPSEWSELLPMLNDLFRHRFTDMRYALKLFDRCGVDVDSLRRRQPNSLGLRSR